MQYIYAISGSCMYKQQLFLYIRWGFDPPAQNRDEYITILWFTFRRKSELSTNVYKPNHLRNLV